MKEEENGRERGRGKKIGLAQTYCTLQLQYKNTFLCYFYFF